MSSRKRKQIEPKQIDSEEEVLLEKIQSKYDNMMRQTHVCCCSIYAHGLFNKKFNENLKTKPDLAQQLSSSDRCAVETETKDCGSCVPNRVFTV